MKGTKSVDDGAWHHVTAVYDGSNKLLYVDGDLDASTAVTGSLKTNNFEVRFGAKGQKLDRGYNGKLDEVSIYDVALSADEVKRLAESR